MKIPTLKKSVFKKEPIKKNGTFYRVIKNSYHPKKHKTRTLSKEGYVYDQELSNDNQQVYYNDVQKKLVFAVTGTHNLKDIITDGYLLFGGLKKTSRYKEADATYLKARSKYKPLKSTVVGHSLGGSIASGIGKGEDVIMTYNKGATFGQRNRKNEITIHTTGDLISALVKRPTKRITKFTIDPHSSDHLYDQDLEI